MIGPSTYALRYQDTVEQRTAGHMPVFAGKKKAEAVAFEKILDNAHSNVTSPSPAKTAPAVEKQESGGFFKFVSTLLDIINPLQHIPVISTMYRQATGDDIGPAARMIGDTLYGGPIGAAIAFANVTSEKVTGRDIGENVVAMMSEKKADAVALATVKKNNDDIIWDTPAPALAAVPTKDFLASALPLPTLPHRMEMSGKEPVTYSHTYAPPVSKVKNSVLAPPLPAAASTLPPVLQSQDAPAVTSRMAVPPELIASRMMEAIDKYTAMKKGGI